MISQVTENYIIFNKSETEKLLDMLSEGLSYYESILLRKMLRHVRFYPLDKMGYEPMKNLKGHVYVDYEEVDEKWLRDIANTIINGEDGYPNDPDMREISEHGIETCIKKAMEYIDTVLKYIGTYFKQAI